MIQIANSYGNYIKEVSPDQKKSKNSQNYDNIKTFYLVNNSGPFSNHIFSQNQPNENMISLNSYFVSRV